MKKFSIIVPIYNVKNAITKCISSILNQSFRNYELLLIDDGSNDGSEKICDDFARTDTRIRIFHTDNRGVSAARNLGLCQARGQYVVFVDSDDYLEKDYLETFNQNCQEDDFIIGGYYLEKQSGEVIKKKSYGRFSKTIKSVEEYKEALANGCFNYVWGRIIKHSILVDANLRFNEMLTLGEDTVFIADLLRNCNSVKLLSYYGYHYVKYDYTTLTSIRNKKEKFKKIEIANREIYDALRKKLGSDIDYYMALRIGKGLLAEVISDETIDKDLLKFLFHQYWFRKTLKYADEIYCDESAKFRTLLKTKSYLLVYIYLKHFR